jgi:hypothetical protein
MLNEKTYLQLKEDIDAAFDIAKTKRDAEHAALELLWNSHGDSANTAPAVSAIFPPSLANGSSLVDGIKKAINTVPSPFTRRDVMDWLNENRKELRVSDRDVSVATALSRMVGTEIKVSQPGAGRRLAKYEKIVSVEQEQEPRFKRPLPVPRRPILVPEDTE